MFITPRCCSNSNAARYTSYWGRSVLWRWFTDSSYGLDRRVLFINVN